MIPVDRPELIRTHDSCHQLTTATACARQLRGCARDGRREGWRWWRGRHANVQHRVDRCGSRRAGDLSCAAPGRRADAHANRACRIHAGNDEARLAEPAHLLHTCLPSQPPAANQPAMPCHAMPCHAMPCHAMPCHAMRAEKTLAPTARTVNSPRGYCATASSGCGPPVFRIDRSIRAIRSRSE
jgi:hypothetical protein